MREISCIFDHIQKTGGTAWAAYVKRNFPDCRVSPLTMHEDIRFAHALCGEHEVVAGHFELTPDYRWPPDIYHMTLLREPVDRFLSHFYYVRANETASEPFAQLARAHDLDEAVALGHPEIERHIRHFYMRHFLQGMHAKPMVEHLLATGRFSVAGVASFVLGHYDLVGVTEHIDLAADCFGHHMRGVTGAEMPVERVTRDRPGVADVAPATLATLRRLSAADRALYDMLRAAFFRTVRRVITSAGESGRAWRRRVTPVPSAAGVDEPICVSEGVDIFCPVSPANNRVVCGERCTLSTVFRLLVPADGVTVRVVLRNQLRQVAFRDSVSTVLEAGSPLLELTWSFVCALGEGSYDCDFEVAAVGAAGVELGPTLLESAYQFEVAAPLGASAAGATWLAPTVAVSAGSGERRALLGCILVVERHIVAKPGERLLIPVTVRNSGDEAWPCTGFHRVVLGVTVAAAGQPPSFDSACRHALPADLAAGEDIRLDIACEAPAEPGEHVVWVGVVQEWISWFCVDEAGIVLRVDPPMPRRDAGVARQEAAAA